MSPRSFMSHAGPPSHPATSNISVKYLHHNFMDCCETLCRYPVKDAQKTCARWEFILCAVWSASDSLAPKFWSRFSRLRQQRELPTVKIKTIYFCV